jgi:hypothetical protein
MDERMLLMIGLLTVLLSSGCFQNEPIGGTIACDPPHVSLGASCCLDQNNNSVCDVNEQASNETESAEPRTCVPDWRCQEWSDCYENNTRTRRCSNVNNCPATTAKPAELEECNYVSDINGAVIVGDMRYQITGVEILSSFRCYREGWPYVLYPDGILLDIGLSIRNTGKEPKAYNLSNLRVIDQLNRTFHHESEVRSYKLLVAEELGPSFARTGHVLFDIPPDSRQLKLIVSDGEQSDEKHIEIGNLDVHLKCPYVSFMADVNISEETVCSFLGLDCVKAQYIHTSITNGQNVTLSGFRISAHSPYGTESSWDFNVSLDTGERNPTITLRFDNPVYGVNITSHECPAASFEWRNT